MAVGPRFFLYSAGGLVAEAANLHHDDGLGSTSVDDGRNRSVAAHERPEVLELDGPADKAAEHVRLLSHQVEGLRELVSGPTNRLEGELVTTEVRNVDRDAVMATKTDDGTAGEYALRLDERLEQRVGTRALDHARDHAARGVFELLEGCLGLGHPLRRAHCGLAEHDDLVHADGEREIAIFLAAHHDGHFLARIDALENGRGGKRHHPAAGDSRPQLVGDVLRKAVPVIDCLKAARYGFDAGRQDMVCLQLRRQVVSPLCRPVEVVGHAAVHGRSAHVLGVRAAVVEADLAGIALLAGDARLDRDDVTDFVRSHVVADSLHDAHELVTHRDRLRSTSVSRVRATFLEQLDVRAADATSRRPDSHFVRSRGIALDGVHPELIFADDVPATATIDCSHSVSFLRKLGC